MKRRKPLLERLVLAWRIARGRSFGGAGAARASYRAARSDDGGPPRRRGYSVIPDLLNDYAERAGEGAVTLPEGAVEMGGDRPGAISHADTFNAPARPPRVVSAPPPPTPAPPRPAVIYYQGQVFNAHNFPAYFR